MRNINRHILLLLGLCCILVLMTPEQSFAETSLNICPDAPANTGVTYKLVGCIEHILTNLSFGDAGNNGLLQEVNDQMRDISTGLIILYIMFLGVKISLIGVQNLRGEIVIALFTVLLVGAFVSGVTMIDYIEMWKDFQKSMIEMIFSATRDASNAATTAAGNTVFCNYDSIWSQLDCVMANLVGANADNADARSGTSTGFAGEDILLSYGIDFGSFTLFRILGGMVHTEFGIPYMILIIIITILFVLAVSQAILVYITSLFAIMFFGMIAPIMIPMALFEKTQGYFDKWVRYLFAYFLSPVIVFAFLTMFVSVMGYVFDRDCPSPPTGQARCGIINTFEHMRKDYENEMLSSQRLSVNTYVAPQGQPSPTCDDLSKTVDNQCENARFITMTMDHETELSILRELVTIAVLLMVMFGFLSDVLTKTGELTGTPSGALTQNVNVYNKAINKIFASSNKGK